MLRITVLADGLDADLRRKPAYYIFLIKGFILLILICVYVRGYVHMNAGSQRGQKRLSEPLGARITEGCERPTWVLEIDLWSSLRSTSISTALSTS